MSTQKNKSMRVYSSDLLALERYFLKAVKKQKESDTVTDTNAIDLLHTLDKKISHHVDELEQQVERLGGDIKKDIKSKLASFTGTLLGLVDNARQDPLSKMLRDDYTTLSMLSIGYTMLHTLALGVGDDGLSELSKNHLSDYTQLVTEVSRIVPIVVSRETIDDKEKAEQIGKKALENTQALWSPGHVNKQPHIV